MNNRTLRRAAAVAALVACPVAADTIHVDDDNCPGPGSGSADNPYCSIQTAIDNAADFDEIVVAPGTYDEWGIDPQGKVITLHSSDGPAVTTIDAHGMFVAVACYSGEGPGTVVEGFTITGCIGVAGGAMWVDASSPTVTDCTFTGNSSDSGAGIYIDSGSPTVTGCTFSGNAATNGGGMYCAAGSGPTVSDCTFTGNTADWGGGMYSGCASLTLTGCTFTDNSATLDGGGLVNHNGSLTVIDCAFGDNTASAGGGIYNNAGTLTVTDSDFCGNAPEHLGGPYALSGDIQMLAFCPIPACPGDADGDGVVGVLDFLELLANWGSCP
jgi:parallel beta-helix repeat protein